MSSYTHRQRRSSSRRLALVLIWLHAAAQLLANPEGGVVVAGQATIHQSTASLMQINQATERAIINWNSFSNAAGETVRFQQPSPSAIALNRVVGVDPSRIAGALEANGRVFLINPNGIMFTSTARVDVGGLLASTLSITDGDFLKGHYSFKQDPSKALAAVLNQGKIQARERGEVVLLAPLVSNSGEIVAALGQVVIGAGTATVLNIDGRGRISVAIQGGGSADVTMPKGAPTELIKAAINTTGIAQASQLEERDGKLVLTAAEGIAINAGTIVAEGTSGHRGGSVTIDSSRASALLDRSAISASGRGLDASGGDVVARSAGHLGFAEGARIEASATGRGDAGSIEVSGKRQIQLGGTIRADFEQGARGQVLIDPAVLTVIPGGTPGPDEVTAGFLESQNFDVILVADNLITVRDLAGGFALPPVVFGDGSLDLQPGVGLTLQAPQVVFENTANSIVAARVFISAGNATVGRISTIGGDVFVNGTIAGGMGTFTYRAIAAQGNVRINGYNSVTGAEIVSGNLSPDPGPRGISITSVQNLRSTLLIAGGGGVTVSPFGPGLPGTMASVDAIVATGGSVNVSGYDRLTTGSILATGVSALFAPSGVQLGARTMSLGDVTATDRGGITISSSLSGSLSASGSLSFASLRADIGSINLFGHAIINGGDVSAGTAPDGIHSVNIQSPNVTVGRVSAQSGPVNITGNVFSGGQFTLGGAAVYRSISSPVGGTSIRGYTSISGGDIEGPVRNISFPNGVELSATNVRVGRVTAPAGQITISQPFPVSSTLGPAPAGSSVSFSSLEAGRGAVRIDRFATVDGGDIVASPADQFPFTPAISISSPNVRLGNLTAIGGQVTLNGSNGSIQITPPDPSGGFASAPILGGSATFSSISASGAGVQVSGYSSVRGGDIVALGRLPNPIVSPFGVLVSAPAVELGHVFAESGQIGITGFTPTAATPGVFDTRGQSFTYASIVTPEGRVAISGFDRVSGGDIVAPGDHPLFQDFGGVSIGVVGELAVSRITASSAFLFGESIGSPGAPIPIQVSRSLFFEGRDAYLRSPGSLVIDQLLATGIVDVTVDTGDMTVGVIEAASVSLRTGTGRIVARNLIDDPLETKTPDPNVRSLGNASLVSARTIGSQNAPIRVDVAGSLSLAAGGQIDGISAALRGVVRGDGPKLLRPAPGAVLFNGKPLSGQAFEGSNPFVAPLVQLPLSATSGTSTVDRSVSVNAQRPKIVQTTATTVGPQSTAEMDAVIKLADVFVDSVLELNDRIVTHHPGLSPLGRMLSFGAADDIDSLAMLAQDLAFTSLKAALYAKNLAKQGNVAGARKFIENAQTLFKQATEAESSARNKAQNIYDKEIAFTGVVYESSKISAKVLAAGLGKTKEVHYLFLATDFMIESSANGVASATKQALADALLDKVLNVKLGKIPGMEALDATIKDKSMSEIFVSKVAKLTPSGSKAVLDAMGKVFGNPEAAKNAYQALIDETVLSPLADATLKGAGIIIKGSSGDTSSGLVVTGTPGPGPTSGGLASLVIPQPKDVTRLTVSATQLQPANPFTFAPGLTQVSVNSAGAGVNVRSIAQAGGASLQKLKAGDPLEITGSAVFSATDGHWFYPVKVAENGATGYVAAGENGVAWLSAGAPPSQASVQISPFPSTTTAKSTPPVAATVIAPPRSQETKPPAPGTPSVPPARSTPAAPQIAPVPQTGSIVSTGTSAGLNLRARNDTASDVKVSIPNGTGVTIIGTSYNGGRKWHYVDVTVKGTKYSGYVAADLVK